MNNSPKRRSEKSSELGKEENVGEESEVGKSGEGTGGERSPWNVRSDGKHGPRIWCVK